MDLVRAGGGHPLQALSAIHGLKCLMPLGALPPSEDILLMEEDVRVQLSPIKGSITVPAGETIPWGVSRIQAPVAWGWTTGSGVNIGVIDTGIQSSHPDLQGNYAGGYNTINPGRSPEDDNGHGTHVAGTIAATATGRGVIGVAATARLYGIKVLDAQGSGYVSNVIEGIQWCLDHGMQVINMSLSTPENVRSLELAVKAAYEAGILVVAAAGNRGKQKSVEYPAKYPWCIAVGAMTRQNKVASFSSRGQELDLLAPGMNILSTYAGSTYRYLSGTSMAAPHVTGVAALVWSIHPSPTPHAVALAMKASAERLKGLPWTAQGAGLVRADRAVRAVPASRTGEDPYPEARGKQELA